MKDMLKGVGPSVALGRDTKLLREVLDQTVEKRLNSDLAGQPEVEAELRETLAMVLRELGEYPHAEALLRQALSLQRNLHGEQHEDVASVFDNLGQVLHLSSRWQEAETCYRDALGIWKECCASHILQRRYAGTSGVRPARARKTHRSGAAAPSTAGNPQNLLPGDRGEIAHH